MPKLFYLFFFSFIIYSFSGRCNSPKEKLLLADSLFAQKKYTQSFELYEDIKLSEKQASPAMLLKMAFIKEGLGDYTNALYYLNLYYLQTFDKRVLKKMENLAEQHQLYGYDYDDVEFFLNLYHQYQLQVDFLVIALVFLFFGILFYRKKKFKLPSIYHGIAYLGVLLLLLFLNNFGREHSKAIVTASDVPIMKGPSSGSDVVEVISNGHRVDVLGQDDVWVRISWNEKVAYIKAFNLRPINL